MTDSNTSRRLPAASGWYWFRDAATAVGRKPLNLLAVTMLYLLIMGFLSAIPYAGIVFAALFMPFGTAFIGRSTRTALQGGDPRLSELKAVFADPVVRQNLMRIGFVYGFILITVNALYGLMAADSIALWKIDANDRLDWASVQANIPWDAIVAVTVVYIPGLMAVWFAPLLASEKRMSWGQGRVLFVLRMPAQHHPGDFACAACGRHDRRLRAACFGTDYCVRLDRRRCDVRRHAACLHDAHARLLGLLAHVRFAL